MSGRHDALRGLRDARQPDRARRQYVSGERIMTTFLESTIAWAVPCLIATAIVVPVILRKLRTRRALEAIHQAREHRDE
ncbi:hypothetical protein SAMD00023378_3305 [Ralstonia sp. NT80]|nr:hypothetical protein SAMD00023378_3305 [Ralstonia sp. NT80]